MKLIIATSFLLSLAIISLEAKSLQPFIVGGAPANPKEFPFLVGIWSGDGINPKSLKCGGVIIQLNVILTSAGCLIAEDISNLEIIAGDHNLNDHSADEQRRSVSSLIFHEEWDFQTSKNDIALIILAEPLTETDAVSIIPVSSDDASAINSGTIIGWGDNTLRKANVLVSSEEECLSKYGSLLHFGLNFCAGDLRSAACKRDQGGPFISAVDGVYKVYGIISVTRNCVADGIGELYTDVSSYTAWINEKLPRGEIQLLCTVI